MAQKKQTSRFVTARTFARAVGISQITAKRWMLTGQARTEPVGELRYILATEIERHRALRKEAHRNAPRRKT